MEHQKLYHLFHLVDNEYDIWLATYSTKDEAIKAAWKYRLHLDATRFLECRLIKGYTKEANWNEDPSEPMHWTRYNSTVHIKESVIDPPWNSIDLD